MAGLSDGRHSRYLPWTFKVTSLESLSDLIHRISKGPSTHVLFCGVHICSNGACFFFPTLFGKVVEGSYTIPNALEESC